MTTILLVDDSTTIRNMLKATLEPFGYRILEAAGDVSDLSRTIASATRQQSEASQQTVESMNTISSLTDGNNASIQHVAVAASEMNSLASRLQELSGRFRFAS